MLDVLWTFVVFFAWLIFLWLLVKVIVDIVRRRSSRGRIAKALWIIFVILVPVGGVFFYLLARVLGDLLPRRDVSGGSKALWIVLFIVLPYVGLGIYLLSQRAGMAARGTRLAKIRGDRPAT